MSGKVKPIVTERLILQEIREEDAPLIVQWRAVPEVYQYFCSPKAITVKEHLNWYFNNYMKDKYRLDFIVIERASWERTGVFSIKLDVKNKLCCEIGYLLDKKAQGKGYAQEGVKRLLLLAKEFWKCQEAIFLIHEENKASQALACRLGFKETSRRGKFILYHTVLKSRNN